MDDYLPPIVTRLKGDWSDLRAAFVESRAAAQAWAAGIREDITSGLRRAGHEGGLAFADALKATAGKELLDGFDEDVGRKLAEQGRKAGQDAGGAAARSFVSSFSGMGMPLLISALVMLTPMIGTAIATAITLGLGLGFVGIAALVQKSNPLLVKAATSFKDTVVAAFKDATSPMVGPMVAALGILAAGIKAMAPAFKEIFASISRSVPNLAHGLIEMIQAMLPGLQALAPVMGTLISTLAVVLPDIGAGLSGLFIALAEAAPEMIVFLEDFGEVTRDVLPMVGTLLASLAKLYMLFEHGELKPLGLFGMIENLAEAWPKVVFIAKEAWEWITKVAGAVGDWVSGTSGDVAAWWNNMVEQVQTKGKAVQDWFEALPGRIGDWLAALPGRFRDAAVAAFDAFFFAFGFATIKILQFVATLPDRLSMWAAQTWLSIKEKFVGGAEDTGNTLRQWTDRIPIILEGLWLSFVSWGRRTWESVTNWVHVTVTDVMRWWDSLPGRVSAANDRLIATIKAWASGAIGWLYQTGKNMIFGLIDGITDTVAAAVRAVQRAIQRIIDGARGALDEGSPSRVFAAMGRNSMLGYVQGLQSEQGMLARAWMGLTPSRPVIGTAPGSALAAAAAGAAGGGEPILVRLVLDGATLVEKLIVPAQERKKRTGETGLG